MPNLETYLEKRETRYLDELLEFLRFPSISCLPEHADDVRAAANWVAERLRAADLEDVGVYETDGHPVVYGGWLHAPGQPTVLIYGHFDTQPVDPLEEWTHPPFEPVIRDDRVYARGASDNKGNMLIPIQATEALLKSSGELPVNVKFLFEGEEEIGSPNLTHFIETRSELLACDMAINADTHQWSEDQPALLIGLRGACALQIDVLCTNTDMHSGIYGGAVQNPIHALVQLLDSMRSPDGRILVDGFYDGVLPLSPEERDQINALPFDEESYKDDIGVTTLFGEPGYSVYERTWTRPTLEVCGIFGGFQGEGIKSVIPREAHAKILCRLVPNQDPSMVIDSIISHIQHQSIPGAKIMTQRFPGNTPAYLVPPDHPGNQAAHAVLEHIYGKAPFYPRTGFTVPVCDLFLSHLGVYSISFGFGLGDEKQHAPDEFFRLSSFTRGKRAYCSLLTQLAK